MLWLSLLLACGTGGSGSEVPGDPPALPSGPTAQAHHLGVEGDELRLTWFETGEVGQLLTATRAPGKSWTTPATIATSSDFFVNWADTPSVVRGGDGRWVAHFAEKSGAGTYSYDVQLARSTDGQVWERLGPAHDDGTPTEHGFVSMWPTDAGVGLLWLDGRETATAGPMALRTATLGDTLGPSTVVDDRVCDCCGTSVALAPDGTPVALFRDRDEAELRDTRAVRLDGSEGTTIGDERWQVAGCPVNGPRLVRVGGAMIAAWTTGAPGALEVRAAASLDGGRSFGPLGVVADGEPAPLGRVDLIADGDGALVSWLHLAGKTEAAVRVRRLEVDGLGLRAGPPRDLGAAVAGRSAGFPRIAIQGETLTAVWTDPKRGLVTAERPTVSIQAADQVLPAPSVPATPAQASAQRPGIEGTTLDGAKWSLSSVEGPVLVALWASWCAPCRAELPVLKQAVAAGVPIVLVAVEDRAEAVTALTAELGVPVALVSGADAREAFATSQVPALFLYDEAGKLAWSQSGAAELETLTEAVAALD